MLYRINKSISIEGTAHSAGSFVDSGECPHILPCIESCLRMGSISEATAKEVDAFTAAGVAKEEAAEKKAVAAEPAPVPDPPKTKPKRARAKS